LSNNERNIFIPLKSDFLYNLSISPVNSNVRKFFFSLVIVVVYISRNVFFSSFYSLKLEIDKWSEEKVYDNAFVFAASFITNDLFNF
jgi:hypothetical protein